MSSREQDHIALMEADYPLQENWSIVTVKYGCNRTIFIVIPFNNNNVTLVKSGSK
jgi:hypothetical protein